jgi:hypothetical protein
MVEHAAANAARSDVANAHFAVDGTAVTALPGRFDFVHSVIVLQHIHPRSGYLIVERLVNALSEGGVGALHVTYRNPLRWHARIRHALYARWPRLRAVRRRLAGGAPGPVLPMYTYDVARVLAILRAAGVHRTALHLTHEGLDGAMILFRREAAAIVDAGARRG